MCALVPNAWHVWCRLVSPTVPVPLVRAGSSKEDDREEGAGGAVSSGLESRRDSESGHGPEDLALPPEDSVPGRVRGISIAEISYKNKDSILVGLNM